MPTNSPTPITRVSSETKQPQTRGSAATTATTKAAIHATAIATAARAASLPDMLTKQDRRIQFDAALYHAGKIVAGLHFGIPPTAVIPAHPDGSSCATSVLSPNIAVTAHNLLPISRMNAEEDFQRALIIEYAGAVFTQAPADYRYAGIVDEAVLLTRLRTNEWAQEQLAVTLMRRAAALMRRPDYLRATLALAHTLFAAGGHLDPETALATVREAIARYHAETGGEPLRSRFHRLATGTRSAIRVFLPNSPWARAQIHEVLRPSPQ